MRLRIRGPSGATSVTISDNATWGELRSAISEKTSVPDFDVKYGYPPKALDTTSFVNETSLADIGVRLDGEQLTIMPRDLHSSLSLDNSTPAPLGNALLPALENIIPPKHQPGDFPSGSGKQESRAAPLSLTRKQNNSMDDPPEIPLPSLEGVLVLRVMPDDNSCMFRALGSAVLGDALDGMNEVHLFIHPCDACETRSRCGKRNQLSDCATAPLHCRIDNTITARLLHYRHAGATTQ